MTWQSLLADVYDCTACGSGRPGPRSPRSNRFPRVIGRAGATSVQLLFVGINPRISETNADLHQWVVSSEATFEALSGNRVRGQVYLGERSGGPLHLAGGPSGA